MSDNKIKSAWVEVPLPGGNGLMRWKMEDADDLLALEMLCGGKISTIDREHSYVQNLEIVADADDDMLSKLSHLQISASLSIKLEYPRGPEGEGDGKVH